MMKLFPCTRPPTSPSTPPTPPRRSLPLAGSPVQAGFPSPAEDYTDDAIDLNRELIRNPSSTFYARVKGLSMKDAGIADGDLLVIDRSLPPIHGKIAVCYIDGNFTLKRLKVQKGRVWLLPENPDFQPIEVSEDNDFSIWGIVSFVIKKL